MSTCITIVALIVPPLRFAKVKIFINFIKINFRLLVKILLETAGSLTEFMNWITNHTWLDRKPKFIDYLMKLKKEH